MKLHTLHVALYKPWVWKNFAQHGSSLNGKGAMKPYFSGAILWFCALSTSLTLALLFLCRLPMFFPLSFTTRAFWFPYQVRYQVLCHPQNHYSSDHQLFVNIKGSSALAVYKRFKFRAQVVRQLLYTTFSLVIRFVAWDAVVYYIIQHNYVSPCAQLAFDQKIVRF